MTTARETEAHLLQRCALAAQDVVHQGWVISLPRLRGMLTLQLNRLS